MDRGFYTCIAVYPSVPYQRTGLRFLLTIHHTEEDIDNLLEAAAEELPFAMEEENLTFKELHRRFKLETNQMTLIGTAESKVKVLIP